MVLVFFRINYDRVSIQIITIFPRICDLGQRVPIRQSGLIIIVVGAKKTLSAVVFALNFVLNTVVIAVATFMAILLLIKSCRCN